MTTERVEPFVPNPAWEIAVAPFGSDMLLALLSDHWEPFGVGEYGMDRPRIYVKRRRRATHLMPAEIPQSLVEETRRVIVEGPVRGVRGLNVHVSWVGPGGAPQAVVAACGRWVVDDLHRAPPGLSPGSPGGVPRAEIQPRAGANGMVSSFPAPPGGFR